MSNQTITYVVGAGSGLIALIAFCALVLVPALSSYRRPLHRIGAAIMSLYVLAAFIAAGILLGALIILEWPRIF